jgi:hypothetical protein
MSSVMYVEVLYNDYDLFSFLEHKILYHYLWFFNILTWKPKLTCQIVRSPIIPLLAIGRPERMTGPGNDKLSKIGGINKQRETVIDEASA